MRAATDLHNTSTSRSPPEKQTLYFEEFLDPRRGIVPEDLFCIVGFGAK